jgi:hypothetical protein
VVTMVVVFTSCLPPLVWLQLEKRPNEDSTNTVESSIFFIYEVGFVLIV